MPLSTRFEQEFLEVDRWRGEVYFHEDRVRIVDERSDYAASLVRGTGGESYFVQLEFAQVDANQAAACCECERYKSGFFCKHLWATIRALEQHPDLAHLPGHGEIALHRLQSSEEPLTARRGMVGEWPAGRGDRTLPASPAVAASPEAGESWRQRLRPLLREAEHGIDSWPPHDLAADASQRYWLVISAADQSPKMPLCLQLYRSQRRKDGAWSVPRPAALPPRLPHEVARPDHPLAGLARLRPYHELFQIGLTYGHHRDFYIDTDLLDTALQQLSDQQMLTWTLMADRSLIDQQPVIWDPCPWDVVLRLERDEAAASADSQPPSLKITCQLVREGQRQSLSLVVATAYPDLFLTRGALSRVAANQSIWLEHFRREDQPWCIPWSESDAFLGQLARFPRLPQLELDDSLQLEQRLGEPRGVLQVSFQRGFGRERKIHAELQFRYGSWSVRPDEALAGNYDAEQRCLLLRDPQREAQLAAFLAELPLKPREPREGAIHYAVPSREFPRIVRTCAEAGWEVIAHGQRFRTLSQVQLAVHTNTDWFDLQATVQFGQQTVPLPKLLAAVRQQHEFVVLDDGSHGILPEAWLARCADLSDLGEESAEGIRFRKSQAVLLEMLLAEQEQVVRDPAFTELSRRMREFNGIAPALKPRGFHGELRAYQQEGLGWLNFLREFQLGGCLADDMGLGKTIQVLALLQARRLAAGQRRHRTPPSLVVVPKSLVFNWLDEAQRFTPRLRMLDYTGLQRAALREQFAGCDVIVTTYGTVRRDIEQLVQLPFEYVILDEAQAIKNAGSQVSKACRLLSARHRLAMTGTPVENHLGELWAMFDFLNPGMLGGATRFRNLTARAASGEQLAWLAQALRPFILRRTKAQVLQELPAKQEQTLFCEMTPPQSRLYEELRDYYRVQVPQKVDELGINKSKIHVLEALLRLRQAACDPRLLDKQQAPVGAKITVLMEQLQEILEEGHKALVFSQFTSLLALVRQELDQHPWDYEYLDGKTRDRARRVRRFQQDAACRLFLISLKAGGHGLNLTAADYVFILDPWWNPAVEAQAVDRAHRLGQTRSVMAYRLICRNTVEEKILALQQSKKALADAIVMADKSLLSKLSLEDLQLLFSS